MRKVNRIVIHCAATPHDTTVESILRYWREEKGWRNPGYHHLILSSGEVKTLLSHSEIANGARGYNRDSIHIAYIGGENGDDRTIYQKLTLKNMVHLFTMFYPNVEVVGHCDLDPVNKPYCPGFNVYEWLKTFNMEKYGRKN